MNITKPSYLQPRHATLYEIIVEHIRTGDRFLLSYVRRRTRSGLLSALWNRVGDRADAYCDFFCGTFWEYAPKASDGIFIGDYQVKFSGRTAREAATSELTFIVDRIKTDK